MCKGEQCSNWENRPLRKSQTHYAGLDAWILPQIVLAFEPIVAEKGLEMSKFITKITPDKKKDNGKNDYY